MLQQLIDETGVAPEVNQIQLSPALQRPEAVAFHREHGIVTEAWSPLGQGKADLQDETIGKIAEAHGASPAQVLLAWNLAPGNVVISKSVTPERSAANLASLEFHTPQWRWRDGERENPDRIVLDLDPGAPAGLDECAAVAVMLRELLGSLGWPSVPVTSGSKGMQIYARLDGTHSSDDIREFARTLAEKLTEMRPELITAKMTKSLRPGKVFIDWSQNVAAKTTITPWSLRGRNRPFVATPRTWDEIETARTKPGSLRQLDLHDVLDERLDRPDPMDALLR